MAAMFNADEILQIAVDIERNGQAFYRRAAELVTDEKVKKLMLELAEWEAGHEVTFSRMREKYVRQDIDSWVFDPDNEAARYLKAIADGRVFDIQAMADEISSMSEDPNEILKIAMQREKDAVIYFTAIKELVPENLGKADVGKIIGEEMSHIRFLAEKMDELKA